MSPVSSAPMSNAGTNTRSDELMNSFWGGVIALLVAFIPFSPVIDGFTAAYLEEGKRLSEGGSGTKDTQSTLANGFRTGAISGLVLFVPLALAWLYVFLFEVGFPGGPPSLWWAAMVSIIGCLIVAFYTVGIGGIGGILASSLSQRGIISPGDR